ncbi:MAG: hypothetical protein V1668_02395 [Patescibacteria group bacterium]
MNGSRVPNTTPPADLERMADRLLNEKHFKANGAPYSAPDTSIESHLECVPLSKIIPDPTGMAFVTLKPEPEW